MTVRIDITEAVGERTHSAPIVLLHGWASDSACWQNLLLDLRLNRDVWRIDLPGFGGTAPLDDCTLDTWLAWLAQQLPEKAVIMGWSLGGMLATRFAMVYPERVEGLVTFASNLSFVQRDHYTCAMSQETEQGFYQSFVRSPERTLKRFIKLMVAGELEPRLAANQLQILLDTHLKKLPDDYSDAWQQALRLLASIDNRQGFSELDKPGLHIFFDGDALVPASAAQAIEALNSVQSVKLLENCGHAGHMTQIARVMPCVRDYLKALS